VALLVPFGAAFPLWLTAAGLAPAAGLAATAGLIALGARLPGAAGRGLGDLQAAFRASVLDRRAFPLQVALSFATAGLNVAAFAFAARATGTELSLAETMALGPAILAFMLVPLTVSGWGLREGAAAALFPLAGATAEAGLAASVTFGLTFIVAALPGVVPFLRIGRADDLLDDLDDLEDPDGAEEVDALEALLAEDDPAPPGPPRAAVLGRRLAARLRPGRPAPGRGRDAPGGPAE
jgi:uncharacterized membrane protein YbhN (UPF0104 family)